MVKSVKEISEKTTRKKVAAASKKRKSSEVSVKEVSAKETAPKPEANSKAKVFALSVRNLFKNWFNGCKQTFNMKGRSSRYEFWSFLLLNSILILVILVKFFHTLQIGYQRVRLKCDVAITEMFLHFVILALLLPIVSLVVRRVHDLGKRAWADCFKPLFISGLLWIVLIKLVVTFPHWFFFDINIVDIVMTFCTGFYGLKILIMTMFYRGDLKENEYGKPQYNDDEHEERALTLSCLGVLLIIVISPFAWLLFTDTLMCGCCSYE